MPTSKPEASKSESEPESAPKNDLYMDSNPIREEVIIGGQRFVLQEISGEEFLGIAGQTTSPVSGLTDLTELSRLLIQAMVVEPKIDPDKKLKAKYTFGLFAECQRLLGITGETLKNLITK